MYVPACSFDFTLKDMKELDKVDDSLDAVTAGEDNDYSDENLCNIKIFSLPGGRVLKQQCLPLDSPVDDKVDHEEGEEGDHVEQH